MAKEVGDEVAPEEEDVTTDKLVADTSGLEDKTEADERAGEGCGEDTGLGEGLRTGGALLLFSGLTGTEGGGCGGAGGFVRGRAGMEAEASPGEARGGEGAVCEGGC
jgi:hypothetical protein